MCSPGNLLHHWSDRNRGLPLETSVDAARFSVVLKTTNPDEQLRFQTPLFSLARERERLSYPDPRMRAKAAPLDSLGSDPGICVIQPLTFTREYGK